jgi:hypothetical protein
MDYLLIQSAIKKPSLAANEKKGNGINHATSK